MKRGRLTTSLVGLAVFLSCAPDSSVSPKSATGLARSWPGVSVTSKLTDAQVVVAQTIFVPIFSSIATADNARTINLAATLTIRNVDLGRSIVINSIRYHDSGGRLVREFLESPLRVGPLASMDLFVRESDNSGGALPSFLVDWAADDEVAGPDVGAVMINTAGSQGITLTSFGRIIATRHR